MQGDHRRHSAIHLECPRRPLAVYGSSRLRSRRFPDTMDFAQFLRTYQIRAPGIGWLVGAGGSAAGGVPTATDMIWDFKRLLYCTAEHVSLESCADLGDPILRERLQRYFDARGGLPPAGADDEYAAYFEAAYPAAADRRRYIDQAVLHGTPSYGHLALAALMAIGRVQLLWTPNFDRLIEDAAARIFGTSARLVTATLDTAGVALEALNDGRWPLLGKLHGDFQSVRLKNTPAELRQQDARLREGLAAACQRFGLVVVGYSGRDASIMEALEVWLTAADAFPGGLFWLHKQGTPPLAHVTRLIDRAVAAGVDAHVIPITTFDEVMADVLRVFPALPPEITRLLDTGRSRLSSAPMPPRSGGWPVVRLGALRVDPVPASCRLIACSVGGTQEVRDVIARAGAPILATRRRVGVIAFGRDADIRRAFEPYTITGFDLYPIVPARWRDESAEQGLLTEAIAQALGRTRPVCVQRRRRQYAVSVDPDRLADPLLAPLVAVVQPLTGIVPRTTLRWAEGVRFKLEYRLNALWLLSEPTIVVDTTPDLALREISGDFVRARLAARYNPKANALLDAWAHLITAGQSMAELRAFGLADGVDAVFGIHLATAFSRRIQGPSTGRRS